MSESSIELPILRAIAMCEAAIKKITSDIGEYWEFGTSRLPPGKAEEWGDRQDYVKRCAAVAIERQKRLLELCRTTDEHNARVVLVSATDFELITACHKSG